MFSIFFSLLAYVLFSHIYKVYTFSTKLRTFNNSVDLSSLNIFSFSFAHLLLIKERTNAFFQNCWKFQVF